ncbi:MAG: hypothetical protein ABI775_07300 [Pseudonocardiales bacterium]
MTARPLDAPSAPKRRTPEYLPAADGTAHTHTLATSTLVGQTEAGHVVPGQSEASAPGDASRTLDRRSVLKGVGAAGLTVLVAGTGVVSYRVYDNGVLDAGAGTPYDAWSHWRDDPSPSGAVAAAILAANPHNTQPWRFHVTASAIDVFSDPSRRMPFTDPLEREHQIGLGCALENLIVALEARGYRPDLRLLPASADPTHVAAVALSTTAKIPSSQYDAIGSRHSDRGPYTSARVPATTLSALAALAQGLPGVTVRWVTSPAEMSTLSALLIDAAEAVVADQDQSAEGFSWFRNNRDAIEKHRDGLTLDGQGLAPITLTLAKLLPASSRTAGDQFWLTQTRTVHTGTAAAYGVITVTDPADPATRLNGGRLMQRIHLAATTDQLSLQYMNQITERIDRDQATNRPDTFGPRFDRLLGQQVDQQGRHGLVTFRLGHPQRSTRKSPRRSLNAITT